ncbi:hypothetical protein AXX17_AT1G32540 [Arabidopsis thaliana]|uniref:Uncharacterized protein n=1 Tax=Arabidopsis thaliana TaxID=3702 RepID=A0A178WNH5_ARATH|nr:hypothetical protein AXX17_AT1G32540 [Arabidopsis thaliana]
MGDSISLLLHRFSSFSCDKIGGSSELDMKVDLSQTHSDCSGFHFLNSTHHAW